MTDIQTELEQLYAEADKLMEEIKASTKPSFDIIKNVVNKLNSYPYKTDIAFDVYEGSKRHHIFFYKGFGLHMDDHDWEYLGSHDQLVLIYILPTLVRKFIEKVRHENFADVDTISFKKPWWKFR
jgi:hypothetical protein